MVAVPIVPIVLGGQREATALGAGILAGVGAGAFADIPSASKQMPATRPAIQPDRGTARF